MLQPDSGMMGLSIHAIHGACSVLAFPLYTMLILFRVALPNMVYFVCDGRDLRGFDSEVEQIEDGIWEIVWRADRWPVEGDPSLSLRVTDPTHSPWRETLRYRSG